jgi:hypothetical protein
MNWRRMTHWYGTPGPVAGFAAAARNSSGIPTRSLENNHFEPKVVVAVFEENEFL